MTQSDVEKRTGRLEESTRWFERLASGRIERIETAMAEEVQSYRERIQISVSTTTFSLIPYTQRLYLSACYHVMRSYGWGSPQILEFLTALYKGLKQVYSFVKWITEYFHIREILKLVNILSLYWPWLRTQMEKFYDGVSKISDSIGWGADGIMHLLQATQGGMHILGGLMGKDRNWLETVNFERSIDAFGKLKEKAFYFRHNPSALMDYVFTAEESQTQKDVKNWWDKTVAWIQPGLDIAQETAQKLNNAVDQLETLRNEMPSFVRKHIPQAIWNGIDYARTLLDERIPAMFEKIDHSISEINAALESERSKAASLVDELTRPGDVLMKIDALTPEGRADQESKIDDATSRKYEEEVAKYTEEDADILHHFEELEKLAKAPIPEPAFLSIEERPYKRPAYPGVTVYDTWFVGDY